MTDAEFYSLVVTVALITGAVFLAISVLLFFRLKIIKVIGDLTGRSAKKGVKKKSKEDVLRRREQEMQVAKLKEQKESKKQSRASRKTEKISNETVVLEENKTEILSDVQEVGYQETEVLFNETEVLTSDMEENSNDTLTEKLYKLGQTESLNAGRTEVLSEDEKPEDSGMIIEDTITVVNTDKIIE